MDPFRVDTTYKIEDPIKIDTTYKIEDPIKIDTTYLIEDPLEKPISECNSGGDADDSGGNSIKEYDMAQNSGTLFLIITLGLYTQILLIFTMVKRKRLTHQI